ncbi:MAG: hypothetical protein QME96_02595 [Myxococcota bacterium]|nr:hypothetical protein [Myxococcota bacterium]
MTGGCVARFARADSTLDASSSRRPAGKAAVSVVLQALLLGLACAQTGDGPARPDGDVPRDDGGEADGGCRPGETDCSGTCVDTRSDPANCGSCGRRCDAGEVCNEGVCASTCTGGLRNCSGACVDVNASRLHCGGCDRPCAANEECRSGTCVCVPACTSRTCGSDGCGGTCPPGCGTGFTCTAAGACSAFDAAGGIVVACVSPTSSSVRRCTPAGVCP